MSLSKKDWENIKRISQSKVDETAHFPVLVILQKLVHKRIYPVPRRGGGCRWGHICPLQYFDIFWQKYWNEEGFVILGAPIFYQSRHYFSELIDFRFPKWCKTFQLGDLNIIELNLIKIFDSINLKCNPVEFCMIHFNSDQLETNRTHNKFALKLHNNQIEITFFYLFQVDRDQNVDSKCGFKSKLSFSYF